MKLNATVECNEMYKPIKKTVTTIVNPTVAARE